MKYDKMVAITQAESQRKMNIAKNTISDMLKNMEPFCACIPIGVSCTEISDTMISSRAQAIMNSPNTDRNNVLNCIIQNFN